METRHNCFYLFTTVQISFICHYIEETFHALNECH